MKVMYITHFLWYAVSLMMAHFIWAERCCSKILQHRNCDWWLLSLFLRPTRL